MEKPFQGGPVDVPPHQTEKFVDRISESVVCPLRREIQICDQQTFLNRSCAPCAEKFAEGSSDFFRRSSIDSAGRFFRACLKAARFRGTHRPPACSRRAGGKRAFERLPRRPAQGADTNSAVSRRARPQKVGSW